MLSWNNPSFLCLEVGAFRGINKYVCVTGSCQRFSFLDSEDTDVEGQCCVVTQEVDSGRGLKSWLHHL